MFVYANAIPPQKSFLNRPQRIGREQPTMLGFDGLLTPELLSQFDRDANAFPSPRVLGICIAHSQRGR